jgi:hypothetical protein
MIVTALVLFSWIAGVFPNKKIDEEIPEDISSYNAPEIEMNNKDNKTPEVLIPEPLSNPENDAPEVEIGNEKKTDKPDSNDDEVIPPHFFVNVKIVNRTEPDDSDEEVELAPEATEEEVIIPCSVLPLEADLTQHQILPVKRTGIPESPSTASPEGPSSPKRFTFKIIKFPILQEGYYISLRLNERENGMIKKTKIISTRNPKSINKSFSFEVKNPDMATITCKMKRKVLLGLIKSTEKKKKTKVNNEKGIQQLLGNFGVAVVRTRKVIKPSEVKEKKNGTCKKEKSAS